MRYDYEYCCGVPRTLSTIYYQIHAVRYCDVSRILKLAYCYYTTAVKYVPVLSGIRLRVLFSTG